MLELCNVSEYIYPGPFLYNIGLYFVSFVDTFTSVIHTLSGSINHLVVNEERESANRHLNVTSSPKTIGFVTMVAIT